MLSRVADALFWMSRYLERAEHVARLLDVSFHLELDLHGVLAGAREQETAALVGIIQAPLPEEAPSDGTALHDWLTFDLDNPNSIMACVNKARNNARSVRGTIAPAVWRELNKLFWQLKDPDFIARAQGSPHDFFGAVETGCHLFQGLCDATMMHDEGWRFIQLGKFLERAFLTLRILDVKCRQLERTSDAVNLPLAHLQWAAVLKSCLAYEAYQRLYISRVEPERVVEFLLVHPQFPRSVRFCLEEAAQVLALLEGPEADGRAERFLGRALSELRFLDLEEVLHGGLHPFLDTALQRCAQVGQAIQEQYALNY
jgi:uncharacterized alpha-E superfamily protein